MGRGTYRYTFEPSVPMKEVEESLSLAALGAEGIHGRTRVVLDADFKLDKAERACVVDGSTPVGQRIAELFTEFLAREFGEDAFRVKRVDAKA